MARPGVAEGEASSVIEPSLRADAEPVALHTAETPRVPGFERDTRAEQVCLSYRMSPVSANIGFSLKKS